MPSQKKNRLDQQHVEYTLHNIQPSAFIFHTSAILPLYHWLILMPGLSTVAGNKIDMIINVDYMLYHI